MKILIYRIWEDVDDVYKVGRSCELVEEELSEVLRQLEKEEGEAMQMGVYFVWLLVSEDGDEEISYQSAGWNESTEESEMELCEANFIDSTQ